MPSRSDGSRAIIALAIALVTFLSNRLWADDLDRIRPEGPTLKAVMATALERSDTFRALVERIDGSDLIVYLTCSHFESATLAGRTFLVSARLEVRYVRVQIRCQQSQLALVTILGHELQHVVEIASMPEAVDDRSIQRAFSAIGFSTCHSSRSGQFETNAALQTGEHVRGEVVHYQRTGVLARDDAGKQSDRRNGN